MMICDPIPIRYQPGDISAKEIDCGRFGKWLTIFEKTSAGYRATVRALDDCVVTGETWEDCERLIAEAIPKCQYRTEDGYNGVTKVYEIDSGIRCGVCEEIFEPSDDRLFSYTDGTATHQRCCS